MEKVQRLSHSSEYTQAGGNAGQPIHSCKDCGETDPNKFLRRADNGKLHNYCRVCRQARNRPGQIKYASRPEVRDKKAEADAKYAAENRDKVAAKKAEWAAKNADRLKRERRAAYQADKQTVLSKSAAYKRSNPGVVNARCAQRHAAKKQRVPKWLTEFDKFVVSEIYDLSNIMSELTGVQHHVDHIIPLQGIEVSGLHVPSNLRVIPASVNCSKQNKVEDIVSSLLKDGVSLYERRGIANG